MSLHALRQLKNERYYFKLENMLKLLPKTSPGKWSLILIIGMPLLLFIGINYFSNRQETLSLDNISANEIENWMDDYSIGFNSYDIAEVYNDIEINNSLYFEDEISDYLEKKDLEILFLEN